MDLWEVWTYRAWREDNSNDKWTRIQVNQTDYLIEEPAEDNSESTYKPSLRQIIARLVLLLLLLWVLVNIVLPRRNLILELNLPPHPPAEQIEPNYWL